MSLLVTKANQQSQGIQTLLQAEKDAAKVVQEARACAFMAHGRTAGNWR